MQGPLRHDVIEPEEDEHLVLGGDPTMDRTRVADAVAEPGRAVTLRIVPLAELALVRAAEARDRRVGARPADDVLEALEDRRERRRRLALHLARIGGAVVVDRTELVGAAGVVSAVERDRRVEVE